MEDKELHELFEAKRTTEANRRRQEELAAMIGHKARHSRPLWPVWIGAAAASIALFIIVLPMMSGRTDDSPIQIANTDIPEVVVPTTIPAADYNPLPRKKTAPKYNIAKPVPIMQEDTILPAEDTAETIVHPIPLIEQEEEETFEQKPRVMRRTSTMLACTDGCPEPEGYQEPSKRNIHIEFFGSQQYAEATSYTITINK